MFVSTESCFALYAKYLLFSSAAALATYSRNCLPSSESSAASKRHVCVVHSESWSASQALRGLSAVCICKAVRISALGDGVDFELRLPRKSRRELCTCSVGLPWLRVRGKPNVATGQVLLPILIGQPLAIIHPGPRIWVTFLVSSVRQAAFRSTRVALSLAAKALIAAARA